MPKEKKYNQEPHRFVLREQNLVDEKNNIYVKTIDLKGRGQPGLASFFRHGEAEKLIKEDDPTTCFLEGTAYFATQVPLLPSLLQHTVNYATLGTLDKKDGKDPAVVSIQDRIMPKNAEEKVIPWDVIVYHKKRKPKTLWSYESWYPNKIKQNIAALSPFVKLELASALFASAAVGDESFHVGQFMAILDETKKIVGIRRIDLGARERYSVSRERTGQLDPYHDSAQYQKHGQWGKDYISFLLAEPELKKLYTLLWLNLSYRDQSALKQEIFNNSKQVFLEQFRNIPEVLYEKVLTDLLNVINKDAKTSEKIALPSTAITIADKIDFVSNEMAKLDANRITSMIAQAKRQHEQSLSLMRKEATSQHLEHFFVECNQLVNKIVDPNQAPASWTKDAENMLVVINQNIMGMLEKSKHESDEKIFHKIKLLSGFSIDILNAIYFSHVRNGKKIDFYEEELSKYQTLHDISSYSLTTKVKAKLPLTIQMMEFALKGKNDFIQLLGQSNLIDQFKQKQYSMSGNEPNSMVLLRGLLARYQLDEALLLSSNTAKDYLKLIQDHKFKEMRKSFSDSLFKLEDLLVPDSAGKTALHHLMERVGTDEDSIGLIGDVLDYLTAKKVLLDVVDNEGLTPLNVFSKNPNVKEIMQAIDQRSLKSSRLR